MELIHVSSEAEQAKRLGEFLETYSKRAIKRDDVFRVGLSGGSSAEVLVQALQLIKDTVPLDKWRFFLCDERYVDADSKDSNYGYYRRQLLVSESPYHVPALNEDQFLRINSSLPLKECAIDYEKRLREAFTPGMIPRFDVLLLGMGLDGHTCSLFPGHCLLKSNDCLIAALDDAPKPPPARITMTFSLINEADNCLFLISGKEKQQLIEKILDDVEGKLNLPVQMIKPRRELITLLFLNDASK